MNIIQRHTCLNKRKQFQYCGILHTRTKENYDKYLVISDSRISQRVNQTPRFDDYTSVEMAELERKMATFMRQVESQEQRRTEQGLNNTFSGSDLVTDEDARRLCKSVMTNLKVLIQKRDMTVNEVKLTLVIENPYKEQRRAMGFEEYTDVSRDDIASAFMEVVGCNIPKNRTALKALSKDLKSWLMIDDKLSENRVDERYPVGYDVTIPSLGLTDSKLSENSSDTFDVDIRDKPYDQKEWFAEWVGYGTLYLITVIPIFIALSVVALLYFTSFK